MTNANPVTPEAAICRRLVDAINSRDAVSLRVLFHRDYVDVDLSRSRIRRDTAHFLDAVADGLAAFPDAFVKASIAYARDNRIGIYWMVTATQSASLLGIPAAHGRIRFCGFSTLRIRDGVISHGLHLWDMAGLLRELRLLADLTDNTEGFDSSADLFAVLEAQEIGQPGFTGCGA